MTIQSSAAQVPIGRRAPTGLNILAFGVVILLAGLFLWLNLKTTMAEAPWIDEVMQVDAGVNLYLGNGWISTAWPQQSQLEFWAANNPLYTVLVYGWIAIWGFSPVAVRSLNFILILITAGVLVDASRRAGFLQSLWSRFLLAALIICNQAVTFVYRSGRADLVPMLVVVLLFWAYVAVQNPLRRRNLLFLIATLLLASGLHAIPYTVMLLVLDYVLSRKARFTDYIAIFLGCATGGLMMAMLFFWKHSLMAYIYQTFASSYNIVGSGILAAFKRDDVAVSRFLGQVKALSPLNVLRVIAQDSSILPLFAFLLFLILLLRLRSSRLPVITIAVAGLVAAIAIPYGMLAAGRYAFYYAWMGSLPLIVAFTMCVEQCGRAKQRLALAGGLLAGIASIALGMPAEVHRQTKAVKPSQYALVEQIVDREAKKSDVMYGDPVLYYAAKERGIPFLTITYATGRAYPRMTDSERSQVSVIVVTPDELDKATFKVGGVWSRIKPTSYRGVLL